MSALGQKRTLTIKALCAAWAGQTVNGEPALRDYHVWGLMKSDSPKLKELAQLATMMGIPVDLLVCAESWRDQQGRSAMNILFDLDAYPPPPAVASILNRAA